MKKIAIRAAITFLMSVSMIVAGIPVYAASDLSKIELDKTASTIAVGQTEKLKVRFFPENATNKKVKWTSSNTSVATVSSAGAVKGIKAGTATITVTTDDGNKKASCVFNVIYVPVDEVALSEETITLDIGKSKTLKAIISPDNASEKKVTWTSNNSAIATVSTSGAVKGIKAGSAVITAKSVNGKTASCTVNVSYIPVNSVSINMPTLAVDVGKSKSLKAIISPDDASIKKVTWTSSNPAVATVSSAGSVKGIKDGTATITAKTEDGGKTASCAVSVGYIPVEGVTMERESAMVSVSHSVTLKATVFPDTASNKKLIWTSSNPSVATVSSSGAVKALKEGTTTITAKTEDGGKVATCAVTAHFVHLTSLTMDRENTTFDLSMGETNSIKLKAVCTPTDASNRWGTWISSNPSVASISVKSTDGPVTITGLKEGTTTISVIADDGGLTKSCTINVIYVPVADLSLNQEAVTVDVGKSVTLKATIYPSNASNKDITWTSSNPSIATVSEKGAVKGIKEGQATITAKTKDGGKVKTCVVTVNYVPIEGVTIEK